MAHNTWWIDEPRQIHGINLLPLTASSTYLAASPAFTFKNMLALDKEIEIYQGRGKRAKPEDIWQDLFAKYVALVDPAKGLARWNEWGSVELGDTRTHAQHWLYLLNAGPLQWAGGKVWTRLRMAERAPLVQAELGCPAVVPSQRRVCRGARRPCQSCYPAGAPPVDDGRRRAAWRGPLMQQMPTERRAPADG